MTKMYAYLIFVLSSIYIVASSTSPKDIKNFRVLTNDSISLSDSTIIDTISNVTVLQCHHRCRRNKKCKESAMHLHENGTSFCFLMEKKKSSPQISFTGPSPKGKLLNKEETEVIVTKVDVRKTVTIRKPPEYTSCRNAFGTGVREDGFKPTIYGHDYYCKMKLPDNCGEGGWTLAIGSDGSKDTFKYQSPLWENEEIYHVPKGNPSINESKSHAYWELKIHALCLVMKWPNGQVKALRVNDSRLHGRTLLDVMKGGRLNTNLGRDAFIGLRSNESKDFDPYCNAEGFNVVARDKNFGQMRLGILFDDIDHNCQDPNGFLGIGYYRLPKHYWLDKPEIYGGAACNWDTHCKPRAVIPAWSFLYIL